ncbi:MAG: TIGR00153 family protein [Reinekea forsetii]|jgi:predicted phosphate transport protein (TIGR00153 family)|uniref:Phosphate transport regulator (Distant similar to PhoU) n=1 Tax=Reinekea forsetii TaxID=1336806 RepID=A0A2K8KN35_9GAMM|nr:TIGR00153 family protein [Reinekea forsetii]ATX75539.1 phosphate transport regulator (distant similar to PhoU) [Reinekea forsetii]MDO7643927.1 TIGR00153 family protein [Reinekea forsetii]MDO7675235.1 TIGR00153 family protein [Reinekea forsetii]
MSTSSPLSLLFGRSPVKPMQEHISKAHACTKALVPFFEAAMTGDYKAAAKVRETIITLESEADALKKDIRAHLPNSLFMPVPRSDLLELLSMQDRIANRAKDISGIMLGREMGIPKPIRPLMMRYLKAAINTSKRAKEALAELDELYETGFGSKEVDFVGSLLNRLDDQEHKTDEFEIKMRRALRDIEQDFPPIDMMFLYKIIEQIGDLADVSQRVGSRLQILIAR